MHKPLKFTFTEVINAVADGRGIKPVPKSRQKDIVRASEPTPKKK
jgi:hypothetical protein